MDSVNKEVERVCKKQRSCAKKLDDSLESLLQLCYQTQTGLQVEHITEDKAQVMLQELANQLRLADFPDQVSGAVKEGGAACGKLAKAAEKHFEEDVCRAFRPEPAMPLGPLNQAVLHSLYCAGEFSAAESFLEDSGAQPLEHLRLPYLSMHHVMQQIAEKRVEAAVEWVVEQRRQGLARPQREGGDNLTDLHFSLHRVQFVQVLRGEQQPRGQEQIMMSGEEEQVQPSAAERRARALRYARDNLAAFSQHKFQELQRLMGCLVYSHKLDQCPYQDLLSDQLWSDLRGEFFTACCAQMGLVRWSPLEVVTHAGALALPTLLKMTSPQVMRLNALRAAAATATPSGPPSSTSSARGRKTSASGEAAVMCEQLPCEVDLPDQFVFNSVFTCPVGKEQSTSDNPPMFMPCGHVLCRASITKMAKGSNSRPFKCPYCPSECTLHQCKQIHF